MNICMMTNTYLPHVGGVARSVASFCEEYKARKHRTLVVAPDFAGAKENERDVVRVPAIQNFNGSDFSFRLTIPGSLIDRIDEFEPDLIHSHHPFLMGDTAVREAGRRRVPLVFTHHTMYERYTHYMPFDSDLMKKVAIELPTAYANMCQLVIAPSQSVADLIRERGVESRVEVVPTGTDIAQLSNGNGSRGRSSFHIPNQAQLVGHVGRLALEKNLNYLFEAVFKYLKERPQAYFLIVGDGNAESELREMADQDPAGDRVVFAGKQTGQSLADAYAAMDIFVFSSKTETQGMVLAEAMAAGCPVVALDASGVREVVHDGVNGRLLDANASPTAFAEAVAELMERRRQGDPSLTRSVRESAERFSQENCAGRMLALYEDVMAEMTDKEENAFSDSDTWERALGRLTAEWDLVAEKFNVLTSSLLAKEGG